MGQNIRGGSREPKRLSDTTVRDVAFNFVLRREVSEPGATVAGAATTEIDYNTIQIQQP